ncbi:MAG TPA: lipoyl synthase, partial [Thermoplasmataceae archaeon]|nr:lipoyl synthase [Thermoplasmataceae archaeon]
PEKVLESIRAMGLAYAVITSVDRDDLPDQGASHFARVIRKAKESGALIEVLTPDFQGKKEHIDRIISEQPAVFAHNVETVRRLTSRVRDPRAGYGQSLDVLRYIKEKNPDQITKSSIMLGLGESDEEVSETFQDMRDAGVDIVTIGQYLRPSRKQLEVVEYSSSERFSDLEREAYRIGFAFVASGPLVRTSYKAAEAWAQRRLYNGRGT